MTIDFAAGIKDMLENPHKTGIGASINNVQPKVYNDSKSIIIKSNDSAKKTSNNKSGNLTNTATDNANKINSLYFLFSIYIRYIFLIQKIIFLSVFLIYKFLKMKYHSKIYQCN